MNRILHIRVEPDCETRQLLVGAGVATPTEIFHASASIAARSSVRVSKCRPQTLERARKASSADRDGGKKRVPTSEQSSLESAAEAHTRPRKPGLY